MATRPREIHRDRATTFSRPEYYHDPISNREPNRVPPPYPDDDYYHGPIFNEERNLVEQEKPTNIPPVHIHLNTANDRASRQQREEPEIYKRHSESLDGNVSDESAERNPRFVNVTIHNEMITNGDGYNSRLSAERRSSSATAMREEAIPIEQPPDDIIDMEFNQLMLRNGWHQLSDSAQNGLNAYPDSKKWDLISRDRANRARHGSLAHGPRAVRFEEPPKVIGTHTTSTRTHESRPRGGMFGSNPGRVRYDDEEDWWYSEIDRSTSKRFDGNDEAQSRHRESKESSLDARLKRQEHELGLLHASFKYEIREGRGELANYRQDLSLAISELRSDVGLLTRRIESIIPQHDSESCDERHEPQSSGGDVDPSQSTPRESYPKSVPPVTLGDEREFTTMHSSHNASHPMFTVEEIEDPITNDVPELETDSNSDRESLEDDYPGDFTDPGADGANLRMDIYEDDTSAATTSKTIITDPYIVSGREADLEDHWKEIRDSLPISKTADIQYATVPGTSGQHGAWTCTPMKGDQSVYPLKIDGYPLVIPVQHRWPPTAGVAAPPDPRGTLLIDSRADLPIETTRDIISTFEGCIGVYLLVNGHLQIIVPDDFDMEWAGSHYPHRFGGLKVSYIYDTRIPTMNSKGASSSTKRASAHKAGTKIPRIVSGARKPTSSTNAATRTLQLNDIIEARRSYSMSTKTRYQGRIGLKVKRNGEPYLVMPTHVITEAMIHKDRISARFSRSPNVLPVDWTKRVDIIVRNEKFGALEKTFDPDASVYPEGFKHDITIIKPSNAALVKDMTSPITGLGWLSHRAWSSLCQNSSGIEFLASTGPERKAKTLPTNLPSRVECVGRGIFLNQQQTLGSKQDKGMSLAAWKDMISIALLYRVDPTFDQHSGYSGVALIANGVREDGSNGAGVVGFQSFGQHSDVTQTYDDDGHMLDKPLADGIVAFYGAFEVPEQLKKDYTIV